jgi:hypothetical protein
VLEYTKQAGFYRDFPPEGTELVSWFVAMFFGFIIQVRVEPSKLRNLNRFMEQKAWGLFATKSFPRMTFNRLRRTPPF